MLKGWLICVICDSSFFIPSYTNFTRYDCLHIEHVYPVFCARLIIFFGIVELRHYYIYTFLHIQTLHNDCLHIEDVHRRCRSRAEFDLVYLLIYLLVVNVFHRGTDRPPRVAIGHQGSVPEFL